MNNLRVHIIQGTNRSFKIAADKPAQQLMRAACRTDDVCVNETTSADWNTATKQLSDLSEELNQGKVFLVINLRTFCNTGGDTEQLYNQIRTSIQAAITSIPLFPIVIFNSEDCELKTKEETIQILGGDQAKSFKLVKVFSDNIDLFKYIGEQVNPRPERSLAERFRDYLSKRTTN